MWPAIALLLSADLRIDYTRESLTATHVHYQQYIDGIRVIGGERIESISKDGSRDVVERLARGGGQPPSAVQSAVPRAGELVYLNEDGEAKLVSRVVVEEQPLRRYANYYDAATGALVRSDPLFWNSQGRVFEVNPVAKLNRPDLQDQNNAAAAVPESAYSIVELAGLTPSGPLAGPNVQIVDTDSPSTTRADASLPLIFDRSQDQFEEVNAYYHIDRSQRYLQSLGFTGTRRIVGYAIPVDPHAVGGTDNSFFVAGNTPGTGALFFGDGGTDDAEDPDIMLHEFGHAIQESIAPGAFGGTSSSQSRALGEGFGDYWSFSSNYELTAPSGRDPFCIGDWDARCWTDDASQFCGYPAGSDCLRRVDSAKTMADFVVSETPGTEHRNGEIWSSALREIFMALGRRTTDKTVLEGTFGVPAGPTYALMAQKLLQADRALSGGANASVICTAMTKRGILTSSDCPPSPRGEVTWFQSNEHGLSGTSITSTLLIDDTRTIDHLLLSTSIVGDAQVTLIGPVGTQGPVDVFRGRSAAGIWTLVVTSAQPVLLRSWSLAITFVGDAPSTVRPTEIGIARQKFIAAVAHAAGANGTTFITDVRMFNNSSTPARLMLIFTPSSTDGRTSFAAVKVIIPPLEIMALNDIVQTVFQSVGVGQLQLSGNAAQTLVTSRTYTRVAAGTMGQFVPSAVFQEGLAAAEPAMSIPGLENTPDFRSNVGFAEESGAGGEVHVRFYDAEGNATTDETYAIAPYSHLQVPMTASGESIRAEVTVGGDARVLAYGSVIDNHSGDAIFIPAARSGAGLVPAIHAPGANGTIWRTDIWFSNSTADVQNASVEGRSVTIPAHGAVVLRDALGRDGRTALFTSGGAFGVRVTSRTYTIGPSGTFGQFVAPENVGYFFGNRSHIVGVENSAAFRTNVGLINTSDNSVIARVTAYDAAGRDLWHTDVSADRLTQMPVPVPIVDGRITIEVVGGGGNVIPYASVIDNVSGDPIYIRAQN